MVLVAFVHYFVLVTTNEILVAQNWQVYSTHVYCPNLAFFSFDISTSSFFLNAFIVFVQIMIINETIVTSAVFCPHWSVLVGNNHHSA